MKEATTLLAVCALALSAPSIAQYGGQAATCDNGCTVIVTVPAACGSGIQVSMDPITVNAGKKPTISWVLPEDSAWNFAADGIVFANWEKHASTAFDAKPAGKGKKFSVKNNNTKPSSYKYDINLVRETVDKDGKKGWEKCNLDPTVVNW